MKPGDQIPKVFGPGGLLTVALPGYEERSPQVEMATAVAAAFGDGHRLLVEAGTGTGKTLAYLVPAILSEKRTVVSTATKNLQEQIFHKDLPLLSEVLPKPFEAVYLKGRQNYLCLWQWVEFQSEPRFRRKEDVHWWPAVERWALTTPTGDRAEIKELPDDWPTWSDLSMAADGCLGRECDYHGECHVLRARQAAREADLIVVNHHLFFADLALRTQTDGELLPSYEAVIFDEAHNLEEVASTYFGLQVSSYRFSDLLGDVLGFCEREKALNTDVRQAVSDARDRTRSLFGTIARAFPPNESRVDASALLEGPMAEEIIDELGLLEERMSSLSARIASIGSLGEVGRRLLDRIDTLVTETSTIVERDADDMVYVAEQRGRGTFLSAFPIDLRPVFEEVLYSTCATQIYTSATLATDGNFRFFRDRMGLPEDTRGLHLDPVFDYMEQSILYVPENLPDPSDREFITKVAPTMERLVGLCDGRAFLLFTSHRNMNEAFRILAPRLAQPSLIQGQMSRAALLDAFRADHRSVLFATSSFWEGVDVQGESLSLVVIDKLPFASPGDPILRARLDHIEAAGGNPFAQYQVPSAAIMLKQGFGRLIRHRSDFGIIAILDGRLVRRSYGRRFLSSLPRARRSQDLGIVEQWWRARQGDVPCATNEDDAQDTENEEERSVNQPSS